MSLVGQTVRIIVHEPSTWTSGNLFGQITSDRGGDKMTVKLSHDIEGNKLTGDTVQLKPINEKEKITLLEKNYSLMVNATLITHQGQEFVFSGSVTAD